LLATSGTVSAALSAKIQEQSNLIDSQGITIADQGKKITDQGKTIADQKALIAQQGTDIANVAKDVKSLQNENTILTIGVITLGITTVAGVVWALVK
jgi:hypothetical protein